MLISLLRSGSADIMTVIMYILSTLLTIFLVLPLHECAHGFVAHKLGDDTAKREGRLTLNPMKHIDYVGAALLLLIGFGWAKPVPVDSRYFRKPKRDMALTALAGPVSNILAAIVGGLLRAGLTALCVNGILPLNDFMTYIFVFLMYFISINVGLAVFNFIPVPPLDGSKILMAFLPNKAIYWIMERERYLSMGLFVLIMLGGLNGVLNVADNFLYNIITWLTYLPFSWAF